jgi:chemotaxis protein CheC
MNGIMLFLLRMDFINAVLGTMLGKTVSDYTELDELEISALTEVGNIIISSYVNALSGLAGLDIDLSVPAISINMLGGILSVPMIELGYETNKIMIISGKFILNQQQLDSNLLMLPDIRSLNKLITKLVAGHE